MIPLTVGKTLAQNVDVDAFLRACPTDAQTQGAFFQFVCDRVAKERGHVPSDLLTGLTQTRWTSFRKYPLVEFMRLAVNAAPILFAEEPLAEGLRRLGHMSYPSFANTMAGRVVLFAFGEDIEHMLMSLPKVYDVTIPGATLTIKRLDRHHLFAELRGVHCFPDTYHVGVLESGFVARNIPMEITVTPCERISDVNVELRW